MTNDPTTPAALRELAAEFAARWALADNATDRDQSRLRLVALSLHYHADALDATAAEMPERAPCTPDCRWMQRAYQNDGCQCGAVNRYVDALRTYALSQTAARAQAEAERDANAKKYYDVADAITRSSSGPADLYEQARQTRYERDRLRAENARLYTRVGEAENAMDSISHDRDEALANLATLTARLAFYESDEAIDDAAQHTFGASLAGVAELTITPDSLRRFVRNLRTAAHATPEAPTLSADARRELDDFADHLRVHRPGGVPDCHFCAQTYPNRSSVQPATPEAHDTEGGR